MIRVLQSVSNMDRSGIETMLMNYYRYQASPVAESIPCQKHSYPDYPVEYCHSGHV